jgi:hypothetical protein
VQTARDVQAEKTMVLELQSKLTDIHKLEIPLGTISSTVCVVQSSYHL